MQQIDRLKVFHARDSFFNPDTGKFLPSLDTALANSSRDPVGVSSGGIFVSLDDGSNLQDFGMSKISENDIVTMKELKDVCERFGKKPSERQKIIIARGNDSNSMSLSK
jgi:hypothetical protein